MDEQYLFNSVIYTGDDIGNNARIVSPWTSSGPTLTSTGDFRPYPYTISTDDGWVRNIHHTAPSFDLTREYNEKILDLERKEDEKIVSERSKEPISTDEKHAVRCCDREVLRQDNILKLLSKMKGRLQLECMPVRVDHIECLMTPTVKENIIQAYRRVAMYGKKTPFVARFDEYGNRLPDEVKIETLQGVTIKIVNPDEYGEYFLQFTGIVRPYYDEVMYKPSWDTTYITDPISPEDLPF